MKRSKLCLLTAFALCCGAAQAQQLQPKYNTAPAQENKQSPQAIAPSGKALGMPTPSAAPTTAPAVQASVSPPVVAAVMGIPPRNTKPLVPAIADETIEIYDKVTRKRAQLGDFQADTQISKARLEAEQARKALQKLSEQGQEGFDKFAVTELFKTKNTWTAAITYSDGRFALVRTGDILYDQSTVIDVQDNGVKVRTPNGVRRYALLLRAQAVAAPTNQAGPNGIIVRPATQ